MGLKKLSPISVILLSLSLLMMLPLAGCIESDAKSATSEISECDLLQRFFMYALPDDSQLEFLPGAVPDTLVNDIPLPKEGRLVGSMGTTDGSGEYDNVHIVLDIPGSPQQALSLYSDQLMQAGWLEPEDTDHGFGDLEQVAFFCHPGETLTLQATARPLEDNTLSDIRLTLTDYGLCSMDTYPESHSDRDVLPRLQRPEGAHQLGSGSGGGSGSNRIAASADGSMEIVPSAHADTWAKLETDMNLSEVQANYQRQLESSGWQMEDLLNSESLIASIWSFADDEGSLWEAVMTVSAVTQSNIKILNLRAERTVLGENVDDSYPGSYGWSSSSSDAEQVPGTVDTPRPTVTPEENNALHPLGMRPAVPVKVDLESKTIAAIGDTELPTLTDAEKKTAIELVTSSSIFDPPIEEANITEVAVYPFFLSRAMHGGNAVVSLFSGPRIAVVEIELEGDPARVTARVDLDAKRLRQGSMHHAESEQQVEQSGEEAVQDVDRFAVAPTISVIAGGEGVDPLIAIRQQIEEESISRGTELIQADPMGQVILNEGFAVSRDYSWINQDEVYLQTDEGETLVVSIPVACEADVRRGDNAWRVSIDLIEETLRWHPYYSGMEIPIQLNPELDAPVRQAALDLLPTFDETAELLNQGAKAYISVGHRTEYGLSDDGSIFGNSIPKSWVSVYMILDDDLWAVDLNTTAGELTTFFELPPEMHLSSDEKDIVLNVLESQAEAIVLMQQGAQVVFLGRSNDSEDEEAGSFGFAMLHIEDSNTFWTARVNMDTRVLLDLSPFSE